MADEEKVQDPPAEGVEGKEEAEENKGSNATETPVTESGNAENINNDEAAPPPAADQPVEAEPAEGAAPDGGESKEEDGEKPKDETEDAPTEEENANAQEEKVVETTEEGEEIESTKKDEDVKEEEGTDGEAVEAAEAKTEEKEGQGEEERVTEESENKDEEQREEDGTKEVSDQEEHKDGAPPSEGELQDGQTEVAEKTTEEDVEETEEEEGEEPSSPVPQSDTFQDGERPETPTVQVPEPLSREGSPIGEPERLDAGTPEVVEEESPRHEDVIEEEEEEEEPLYSREELLEAFQAALAEREQLQNHNTQLQHKLAEYFKKKKSDDQRQEMDKNVTDQEQRYLKYMSNLEELRNQEEEERENFQLHLEELKEKKQEKLELVDQEDKTFTELKRAVASEAISSRTGKPLMPRVEMYISNELRKEDEVKLVRLDNIKLKNRLKKREQQLKAKEELAEGLHLIDFEQLKIENQTYNEKIEERNEELLKLRKKITSTVQVLTHVKEKLQFVQAENQVQKTSLREVEALVAQKRDLLSRTKKARDSLRIDNQRLRQKCGLLGNTALLRDFEERKDEGEELRNKLDRLKRQHAELILKSAGVKKKIEETRS